MLRKMRSHKHRKGLLTIDNIIRSFVSDVTRMWRHGIYYGPIDDMPPRLRRIWRGTKRKTTISHSSRCWKIKWLGEMHRGGTATADCNCGRRAAPVVGKQDGAPKATRRLRRRFRRKTTQYMGLKCSRTPRVVSTIPLCWSLEFTQYKGHSILMYFLSYRDFVLYVQ